MVVRDAEPRPARSSRPASAIGPPRGLGGAARCCADTMERSFDMSKSKRARSMKARFVSKTRSKAGTRKSAAPHQRARANSKQARVLAAAAPAERGHDRHHHGIHRLAVALSAGVLCRRGAQEARAQACLREDRRRPGLPDRWRGKPGAIEPDTIATQPSA